MLNCIVLDFPTCKVSGVTVLCDDGMVSFVNARQSAQRQSEAFLHECSHELRDDFSGTEVQSIESASRS